jgi:hypothetical protein
MKKKKKKKKKEGRRRRRRRGSEKLTDARELHTDGEPSDFEVHIRETETAPSKREHEHQGKSP